MNRHAKKIIRGSVVKYLYKNKITGRGKLLIDGHVALRLASKSTIEIKKSFALGENSDGNNGRSTVLRLDKGASIVLNGNARIFYGGDIYLFDEASLVMGNSYINSNCNIRITKKMIIGDDCAIGCNFTAMDSCFHSINGVLNEKEIVIGDHVWIGANVTILPGVNIGSGSIIAAGAIVKSDVPHNCMVAGIPARVVKYDVEWGT